MRDSLRRAARYAVGAAQLLRRHPSLLLIALAMAAFTTVQFEMVTYLQFSRRVPEHVTINSRRGESERRVPAAFQAVIYGPVASAIMVLCPTPVPTVSLDVSGIARTSVGRTRDWNTQTRSRPGRPPMPSPVDLLVFPVSLALAFAIRTLVSGGYLGVVWRSVAEGEARWSWFFTDGRRFFWRLIAFGCLDSILLLSAMAIVAVRFYHRGWPGLMVFAYALSLIAFLLGLTRFAIVADDAPVILAIGRSISTIWRDLPVAIAFILGPGAINLCVSWVCVLPYSMRMTTGSAADRAVAALQGLPAFLIGSCMAAALGAWFCAAMFLWYREVRAEPWASGRPEDENATELGSRPSGIVCGGCGKRPPPGVILCPECNAD